MIERSLDGFLLMRSHFDVSKLLESFPETAPRPLHVLQYEEMKFYSDSLATIYCTKLFY